MLPRSERAIPPAPKLACNTRSDGGADNNRGTKNGAHKKVKKPEYPPRACHPFSWSANASCHKASVLLPIRAIPDYYAFEITMKTNLFSTTFALAIAAALGATGCSMHREGSATSTST